MKKMKMLFGILFSLLMVFGLLSGMGLTAYANNEHMHNGITFTEWSSTDKLPTSGNYYLTKDVIVNDRAVVSGTLNLCLNGHTVSSSIQNNVIFVKGTGNLNIMDCVGTGKIQSTNTEWGLISLNNTSTCTLKSGTAICKSNVFVVKDKSNLYLNGGVISCNVSKGQNHYNDVEWTTAVWASGNHSGTIALTDTQIQNTVGCGIYTTGASGSVDIQGGSYSVDDSSSANAGYAVSGSSEGTIKLSGSPSLGGKGIYLLNGKRLTITGALTNTMPICITMNTPGEFTNSTETTYNDAGKFVSANESYVVGKKTDGQLQLVENVAVTGLTLKRGDTEIDGTQEIEVGESFALTAVISPEEATDKTVKWSVSEDNIVGLYSDAACETPITLNTAIETLTVYVKGLAEDYVQIYATSNDNSEIDGQCAVNVNAAAAPVASVTPSGGTATNYTDFAAAVSAWNTAGAGATLKLLADVETDSGITANKGYGNPMILDLNGYGIRHTGTRGSVISVGNAGSLKLTDSDASSRKHYITLDENGRGTSVADSGTPGDSCVEVTGGYITGGLGGSSSGSKGGGVWSNSGFTMEGGTIIGNTASPSGGDGKGGGVYVGIGIFTMTGGTITRNRASTSGGGVYVQGGSTFKLSGNAVIKDNLKGTDKDNVYLSSGRKITITDALTNSDPIGVTMQTPGVFTEGGKAKDYAAKFTSDNTAYSVMVDGDELKLSSHTHSFNYTASGATITATCENTGCDLTDNKTTFTITAPTLTTYGGTGDATATLDGVADFNTATGKTIATTDIKYVGRDGTTYAESATAPTSAGKYTAKITVEEKTASLDYEIAKADPTANAPTGLTATYGQTLANVSLEGKNPEGNTPGTWAWADAEATSVGDVGTNTFRANFTPTDTANYNSVKNVDVTVKVKLGEPRIAGYDLVLDGVLGLRCYVEVPEDFNDTGAAMTFTMPCRENQVIPYGSATDAEGRKVFTCNVYAYQMADAISVSFAYQKDGTTKTLTDTYSVKDYLDKVAADTSSAATLALVNATRNYGHYVQPYLYRLGTGVYQTVMPAGTGTPDIEAAKNGSAAKAIQSTGAHLDSSYFSGAIIRLNVNTGTDLVFELKPVAGFAEQLTATVDDGTSYPVTLNGRGVYRIAKQTIAANNLEVGSSFTVKHDTENVFTITASPMNYISLVLGQSTADDERYALAALYEYWAAADDYHPGA